MSPRRLSVLLVGLTACPTDAPIPGVDGGTDPTLPCTEGPGESTWSPGLATSGTTEETGLDVCAEHPRTDDCCCFAGQDGYAFDACPAAFVCPEIHVQCTNESAEDCSAEFIDVGCEDVGAIDCALDALSRGETAALRWRVAQESGDWREDHELYLLGDGTAIWTAHTNATDIDWQTAVERRTLRSADDFTACAASPSPAERFECLARALTGPVLETCVEASVAPPWI